MKVTRTPPLRAVDAIKPKSEHPPADPSTTDTFTLSPAAAFVERARKAASTGPPFRPDVVDEVRTALAEGRFEASVDLDTALDALLADL